MGYLSTVSVDFCPSIRTDVQMLFSRMKTEDQDFWKSWVVVVNETYLFKETSMHPRLPFVQSFYQLFNNLDIAGLRDQYKYFVLSPDTIEESGYFDGGRLELVRKIDFKRGA